MNEDDMNLPDMNKVAFRIAMEACGQMYAELRATGLSRVDAAVITAAVMLFPKEETNGEDIS